MPLDEITIEDWREATRSADCRGELTRTDFRIQFVQARGVELQGCNRHWTVEVDRQDEYPLRVFESLQPIQHFLDASDGERRDDHLAAPRRGVVDDVRKPLAVIVRLVQAVAVGRLDE